MTKEALKKFILPAAIAVAAVAAIVVAVVVSSNNEEIYRLIKVKSFEGAVIVQREEKMDAFEGLQLISEDSVEVGESSLLELLADSDKHIVAEENTAFVLHSTGTETSGNITIDLLYGKSLFTIDNKLNDESTFEVKTPNATMSVRGTSFSTEYDTAERATNIEVFDGVVHVTYDGGDLLLEKGDAVTIKVNEDEMEVVEGANLDSNDQNSGNDGTEQLFYVGMTYAQEENYAKVDAEYQFGFSEYVGETAENAELSNKIIEIVKSHSDEVNKYFEANKDLAAQNKTESEDITKWFEDTISIGDKYYSVDKVVMDIAVSASSVEREYFTSDTYMVKEKGREMYYCASGVVFEFYGAVLEAPVVTTVPETTTAVTTTTPVTTTVSETTTTPMTTTTVPETTTAATTTTAESGNYSVWMEMQYSDSNRSLFNISLRGYLKDYVKKFNLNENGEINLNRMNPSYRTNYSGQGEAVGPLLMLWSDVAMEHLEELDKTYYDKYLTDGFERERYFTDDIYHLITDLDVDVTDWFPETIDFSYENNMYKATVKHVTLYVCSVVGHNEKDDQSVSEHSPEYKSSDSGDTLYITSHSYAFSFGIDIEKIS